MFPFCPGGVKTIYNPSVKCRREKLRNASLVPRRADRSPSAAGRVAAVLAQRAQLPGRKNFNAYCNFVK